MQRSLSGQEYSLAEVTSLMSVYLITETYRSFHMVGVIPQSSLGRKFHHTSISERCHRYKHQRIIIGSQRMDLASVIHSGCLQS